MSERRPSEHQDSLPDGPQPAAGYNTHAVERLTGVPATTFRAWERRYGVPSPRRLPGGQRVYAERDVAVVRWLRQQTEQGLSASMAVAQLRESPTSVDPPSRASFPPQELSAAVVQAALAFDSSALERAISQALAAHPLELVCLEVVQPALVELGERWHRGEISPAEEHFATALVRRRLEQLSAILETGSGRPLVVLGAAPGEQHEIGALIMSLFLRRRGMRVIYLGADVSLDAVLEISGRLHPDLICLSASTPPAADAVRQVGQALARLDPPGPHLAFGGRAFQNDPALAQGIAGTYLGGDSIAAADAVAALARESEQRGHSAPGGEPAPEPEPRPGAAGPLSPPLEGW
jgi:methanogenic corrinoid protein MtbC1